MRRKLPGMKENRLKPVKVCTKRLELAIAVAERTICVQKSTTGLLEAKAMNMGSIPTCSRGLAWSSELLRFALKTEAMGESRRIYQLVHFFMVDLHRSSLFISALQTISLRSST